MDEPLAKPHQGLLDHLRQVASIGKEIAWRLGLAESLQKRALLACWLHDVGKALRSFQEYMEAVQELEKARERGLPESDIAEGQKIVQSKKRRAFPHALAALAPTFVAERGLLGQPFLATAAVLSHHSPLSESLYGHRERPPEDPESILAFLRHLFAVLETEGFPTLSWELSTVKKLLNLPPAGILYDNSVVGLCDYFRSLPRADFARVKTVLHLADWLASAGKPPHSVFLQAGAHKIGRYVQNRLLHKGHRLHRFQEEMVHLSHPHTALQAPTGTGKTEALLLWAGDADRILYLLPTQATADAMWRRLQRIYGKDAVGLAHGRASYILRKSREGSDEEGPLDLRLFGSVFATPVTVATLDQYLIGHLQGRHWEERLVLSQRATVILDEIHAYEPYTLGLLLEALETFPPKRLALASATLPSPLRCFFGSMPLVQAEEALWNRTRHRLLLKDSPVREGLEEAVEAARAGKRVLVIANTVRMAQELYEDLKDRGVPLRNLRLLHSRFIFRDRMAKEWEVQGPRPGTILVATQVVEVSLDISYDLLITEISPVDALVQRMGRVNRRGDGPPAPVVVHTNWDKGSEAIYGRDLLEGSLAILGDFPTTPTDGDLAEGADALYRSVMSTEDYRKELREAKQNLRELRKILGCYTLDLSDERLRAYFMTRRRGTISADVLPRAFLNQARQWVESGERWKLVELLVPVPAYWVSRYWDQWFWEDRDLGLYVTELKYDSERGIQPPTEEGGIPSFEFI